jgi:hypothetical protein
MLSRRVRTNGFIDPGIPTLAAKPPFATTLLLSAALLVVVVHQFSLVGVGQSVITPSSRLVTSRRLRPS